MVYSSTDFFQPKESSQPLRSDNHVSTSSNIRKLEESPDEWPLYCSSERMRLVSSPRRSAFVHTVENPSSWPTSYPTPILRPPFCSLSQSRRTSQNPAENQPIMRTYALHSITRRTLQPSKFQLQLSTMADAIRPRFSPGEDSSRLMTETTALLDSHWSLDDSHQGLLKTFNFPTYAKALVRLSLPPPLTHH